MKAVIVVSTTNRTVYYGYIPEDTPLTQSAYVLERARCVIYWPRGGGLGQLANEGPIPETRLGDVEPAKTAIGGVDRVIEVAPDAAVRWDSAAPYRG